MADNARASRTGMGHVVEKKYDDMLEQLEAAGVSANVSAWLNAITEGEHDKITETDWEGFSTHLKDGVILCKALNKLLKADDKNPVQFQDKDMSPFIAMTNIESFNKGCMDYGLPIETCVSGDMWYVRKAPFYKVLTTLDVLGTFANSKKFTPAYLENHADCYDRQ